jgi:hypothetical protein
MVEYKGVWIAQNPWKYGDGDYQEILGMDNEPEFIVYAPDVEFYCETIEGAKRGIDRWIENLSFPRRYEDRMEQIGGDLMKDYKPKFLSWAKSYEDEVSEMRELILGNPADVDLLKREYEILTGKRFRRRNNE